jgi:ferrous iron transport protein A
LTEEGKMTLIDANIGDNVIVGNANSGEGVMNKLLALGLINGQKIKVISKSLGGPIFIDIGGSRYAIGRGIADKITVIKDVRE